MIKIGICDDDDAIHSQVQKALMEHDFQTQIEITGFKSGQELLEYGQKMDILLLDICMPGMDGIEVGHCLKKSPVAEKVIMLTSMAERFQEAFEIGAYRFVTKPVDEKKLVRAVGDAIETFIGSSTVEVCQENIKHSFPQREISYIGRLGSHTEVVMGNTAFQSRKTLGDWEKELDGRLFFQVHKSYIVNLSKIESIEDRIRMQSGEVLPVARRRKSELMKKYMQYDLRYR